MGGKDVGGGPTGTVSSRPSGDLRVTLLGTPSPCLPDVTPGAGKGRYGRCPGVMGSRLLKGPTGTGNSGDG